MWMQVTRSAEFRPQPGTILTYICFQSHASGGAALIYE
jgi:hypothetical protein